MVYWLMNSWKRFQHCDSGVTLVEYGIALMLAIAVGTAGLLALGNQVTANMGAATTNMTITH